MAIPSLKLLGKLAIFGPEGARLHLPTRKAELLLARLALARGRAIPRGELAGWLWPDADETKASASLRKVLSWLRTELPGGTILARRNEVWVARESLAVDAVEFEAALDADNDDALAQAAALYHGDLLAGIDPVPGAFEEWLITERARLRCRAEEGLQELIDRSLADCRYTAAADAARRLIAIDAYEEAGHRALLQVLMIQGQRRRAEAHLDEVRALFRDELGVEPSPELAAMVRGHQTEPVATGLTTDFESPPAYHRGFLQIEVPWIQPVDLSAGDPRGRRRNERGACRKSCPDA